MLKPFRENIWTASTALDMFGVELGTRMTIVKIDDQGSLFVHSPIKLTPELEAEINKLGNVKFVVAPNKWHHLFIGDFKKIYPEATFFCAPGLEVKRRNFRFDGIVGADQHYPWSAVLEHKLVEGVPIFNEVVFFHKPSKTLVVTDLAIHICHSPSLITRLALRALGSYGHFGWSKLEKMIYIRNRSTFRKSMEEILKWDIEAIVLTHGEPVSSDGRRRLAQAFL